jgi:hypothetical protein
MHLILICERVLVMYLYGGPRPGPHLGIRIPYMNIPGTPLGCGCDGKNARQLGSQSVAAPCFYRLGGGGGVSFQLDRSKIWNDVCSPGRGT